MTDRDALIKELQHMVDTGEWGAGTMRKAIQALSAPGDAEREELANKLEAAVRTEHANSKADAESMGTITWSADVEQDYRLRIAQLLRRPVEPVVTDEMVDSLREMTELAENHLIKEVGSPDPKDDPYPVCRHPNCGNSGEHLSSCPIGTARNIINKAEGKPCSLLMTL